MAPPAISFSVALPKGVAAIAPLPPASAEPEISLLDVEVESTTETYMITGNTAAELRAKLDEKGPVDDAGRHDALTNWFVKWKYPFDRQGGRCATGPVRAELTLRLQMPQWAHGDDAPEALVEKWNAYVERLLLHEDGHADNGRAAARDRRDAARPPRDGIVRRARVDRGRARRGDPGRAPKA